MPCAETFLGWYVHGEGRPTGPLSAKEVERLIAAGRLHPTEEIRKACRDAYGQVRFFGSHARAAFRAAPSGKPQGV